MDVNNGQHAGAEEAAQEAELSLRDELVKNLADLNAANEDDGAGAASSTSAAASSSTPADKPETTTTDESSKQGASTESTQSTATETKAKAPQSWNAAERAHWEKIPPEVRAVIQRREEEAHRGITQLGQDASFGKKLRDVITPYLPIIRAEGGDEAGAVRDLLQTAYVLRTANADQKVQLFRQLAGQFGVDLSAAAQGVPQVDPQVQALRQELAQVRGHQAAVQQQQHQQVEVQAQQVIDAFAADPKNEFYDQVKPLMGQLLVSGQAQTMQEAYEQACWATPGVRSTLTQRQTAEADAKRAAEAKAKADAKRRAAGSVQGSPGGNAAAAASAANPNLSLRDELRAQFRAATSS